MMTYYRLEANKHIKQVIKQKIMAFVRHALILFQFTFGKISFVCLFNSFDLKIYTWRF